MAEEINKPENRGYADNGIAAFKEAAARFMQREFGVDARPGHRDQPLHRLEAGPGHAAGRFINPGDVTLMTVPGYPVAGTHTQYYGGEVYHAAAAGRERLPPRSGRDSRPTSAAGRSCWCSTIPNSPTGKVATRDFYRPGHRLRPAERDRRRPGRRPHHAHATTASR